MKMNNDLAFGRPVTGGPMPKPPVVGKKPPQLGGPMPRPGGGMTKPVGPGGKQQVADPMLDAMKRRLSGA